MADMKIPVALVFAMAVQLVALVWYISGMVHDIEHLEGTVSAQQDIIDLLNDDVNDLWEFCTCYCFCTYCVRLGFIYESEDKMSEALKTLQEKIGSSPDGAFGPNTAKKICNHYALNPERGAHFLGQLVHESGTFRYTQENLNYSKESILGVFGKYFKSESDAESCARNPQALADRVYGDRMGNDGQGYLWRGRGFLQCTGKNNYSQFAADMDLPEVMEDPDLVATKFPMESAIWFFHRNKLWEICDEGVNDEVIKTITKRVNGGYNGLKHRKEETQKIYKWLNI